MSQSIDAGAIAANIPSGGASSESAPASSPVTEVSTPAPSDGTDLQTPVEPQSSEPASQTPPEQDPDFVRRFNALTRKEQEILRREQEFKSKYGEYENYQKERAKVKENPLEFLEANGWNFKDLADYVLNNNQPTTETQVSKLQRRIDEMEAARKQEIEEAQRREQEAKNQATVTAYKENIKKEVSSKSEQFELINHFGEYDTVYDVIENYYTQNGVILEVEKAAAEVEKYLEQQFEKAASTNKFKKRYSPIEQALSEQRQPEKPGFPGSQVPNEPSTLTNEIASSSASPQGNQPAPYLSEEESKKRAAEILREHILRKKGYTKTS